MADPVTMMAVGAAAGGGRSLLRGKGLGESLKSAAIGGALGGAGGVAGQAMGIGGAGVGVTGASSSVVPNSVQGVGMLTGSDAIPAVASSTIIPSTGVNALTGKTPIADMVSKYGTVDNVMGAGKIMAAMPTNQNHPQASSASPTPAKQMEQALTAGLLDSYGNPDQYLPKKQRYSLLG